MGHFLFQAAVNNKLDQSVLEGDFQNARGVDTVYFGERCFYYPHALKMRYFPYDQLQWAYLRAEENPVSLGCRRAIMDIWYLILCAEGKQVARIDFQKKELAKDALDLLSERSPGCLIGYSEDTKNSWNRICAGKRC